MYQKNRQAYAQQEFSGLEFASKEKLISVIYQEIMACINDAYGFIEMGSIPQKGKRIGKAVSLIQDGLMPALDLNTGGEIAQNLQGIYSFLITKLTYANLHNDKSALMDAKKTLLPIIEAWNSATAKEQNTGKF